MKTAHWEPNCIWCLMCHFVIIDLSLLESRKSLGPQFRMDHIAQRDGIFNSLSPQSYPSLAVPMQQCQKGMLSSFPSSSLSQSSCILSSPFLPSPSLPISHFHCWITASEDRGRQAGWQLPPCQYNLWFPAVSQSCAIWQNILWHFSSGCAAGKICLASQPDQSIGIFSCF